MEKEIKQFVDKMIPAFNQGYKQWHEREWKEFISQIKDQFKQEVIDELKRQYANGYPDWNEGITRAIEIIKSK